VCLHIHCTSNNDLDSKHIQYPKESLNIDKNTVEKLLRDLKPSKSPGPEPGGIHPRVLKELAAEVATPLQIIFQSSISSGTIPQSWKMANITPIFKKGEKEILQPSSKSHISQQDTRTDH